MGIVRIGDMSGELFAPQGVVFKPISMQMIKVRMLGAFASFTVTALIIAAMSVAAMFTDGPRWLWFLEIVPVGILLWMLWLIPRQVRAWGYGETDKDLFLRRGIMFKKMWAIPYGRMQFVDVEQGPIDRLFGVAQVSMKTASQESAASIPGLDRAEADRLRAVLTERGEALRAGL